MEQTATQAAIEANPAFRELSAARGRLAAALTAVMLVLYFGFVLLVAFAPRLLGTPVTGTITLGFPLGLGVILASILLTGVYVARANGAFDRLTREIVEQAR